MSKTDLTEVVIKFGCGFVFGLVFFGLGSIWLVYEDRDTAVAIVLVAASVFGLAALKFGGAFWRWFARWFSWFS